MVGCEAHRLSGSVPEELKCGGPTGPSDVFLWQPIQWLYG
jgi:hypothetical protein